MFLNKIRNTFCVPDTKLVSATNVVRAGKRGNICVRNNVSPFARVFKPQNSNMVACGNMKSFEHKRRKNYMEI